MKEPEIRELVGQVKDGRMSRRDFIGKMTAVGIAAPFAGLILHHAGVAYAKTDFKYRPAEAGGGGVLRMLQWQMGTQLNPHFATGSADQHTSGIFYEPLASWDGDGDLNAVLAEEIPSFENGGLSEDGLSVTWRLKQNVTWHDGEPFTADDVVFTAAYAKTPQNSAYTASTYGNVRVEKLDDYRIIVRFSEPTPFWPDAFVGTRGMILPKHKFEAYQGERSREAPTNLVPVGTSAFILEEFRPGDALTARMNPNYHVPNRPYFDALEIKGGGDAVSAARAVLQTGEYDFAWNLAVEEDILAKIEQSNVGFVSIVEGANVEHLQLNTTDPWTELDGQRSNISTRHPAFSDKAVRQAMALIPDRAAIAQFIYGRVGRATGNIVSNPPAFVSQNTSWEYNLDQANAILDEAGWTRGSDGIREKDGVRLKFEYQTTTSGQRQQTQAVIKQAAESVGIEIDLKTTQASIFFSSDPANPDTFSHFYSDMQMYTTPMREPDPGKFLEQFLTSEIAQRENQWQGSNKCRWHSDAYDALYEQARSEIDPVRRAALIIEMNDMVVEDAAIVPLVYRAVAAGSKNGLRAPLSGWASYMWRLSDWHMDA